MASRGKPLRVSIGGALPNFPRIGGHLLQPDKNMIKKGFLFSEAFKLGSLPNGRQHEHRKPDNAFDHARQLRRAQS